MLTYQPQEIAFPHPKDSSLGFPHENWIVFAWDLHRAVWDSHYYYQIVLAPGVVLKREGVCRANSFESDKVPGDVRINYPKTGTATELAVSMTEEQLDMGCQWVCSPFLTDLSTETLPLSTKTAVEKHMDYGSVSTAGDWIVNSDHKASLALFQMVNTRRNSLRSTHEMSTAKPGWWEG